MTGVLLALSAALIFTVYNLLARVLSVKSKEPLAVSVLHDVFGALLAGIIWMFEGGLPEGVNSTVIIVTLLAAFGYGIFTALKFYTHKYLEASRRTLVTQIGPIVTLIASAILLSEEITTIKLLAVVLIIFGNIVGLYKHGGTVNALGLRLAFIASAIVGITYVGDKFASSHFPLGLYAIITYLLPALFVYIFFAVKHTNAFKKLKEEAVHNTWRLPLLSVLSVAGYYCLLKAFSLSEASTAIPVMYSSTILSALGGIIILKERSNIPQKIIGALFVFSGIILLR